MKSIKCPGCGFVSWADSDRCKKCGAVQLPNPEAGYQQATSNYQGYYQGYASGHVKKGMAITSLVFGILGFFTFGIVGVGAIIGITLAAIALSKAKKQPSEYGGQGVATAGLVLNIMSLVMVVPIGIIAAIAIPNLLASARAANEGSSMSVLRKIHDAEATYNATRGNGSYGTVSELVNEGLIAPELATGVHHGYRFKVVVQPAGYGMPAAYQAVGVPLTYGKSGRRSFYIDESGVMRGADAMGAEATVQDPPLDSDSYYSDSPRRRASTRSPDEY